MKPKMYLSFGALLLGAMAVQAQSSVVAGGCNATSTQGATMGITVGQLAMETFSKNSEYILLGIQQDFSLVKSSLSILQIPNVEVMEGESMGCLNLDDYFFTGETLVFSVTSNDESVVRPMIAGSNLYLMYGNPGFAQVSISAITEEGITKSVSFYVIVKGKSANPTAIEDFVDEYTISVIGKTIYINNINGKQIAVYDIAGHCVYSCKDMQNAIVTMRTVGTYIVKIGNKQQNVVVK